MIEVVVGIDFGTSGSGFAYAYKNNPSEINHGIIYGANADNKVQTQIILDDNDNTLRFGVECIEYIKKNGLNEGHHFKNIKMNLYEKKTIIQAQNSEKKLELKFIIQRIMEKLKNLAIEEIKKNRPTIEQDKIKWVVTVPAIWQEFQKNIMMEACVNAGLIKEEDDKSLFFALEPEAASCYCLENKSIDQKLMKKGDCYIVCDLGGGTGDIVTHLIGVNKNLNEISQPNGGQLGSNEINKFFLEEIVFKIFDCKDFNTYYKKYKELHENNKDIDKEENGEEEEEEEEKEKIEGILYNQWAEFERSINDFKEFTDMQKITNLESYPINFYLFKDIFKNNTDIKALVNNYNSICNDNDLKLKVTSKKKWIIELPHKIIYNYIKKQVDSICKIINDILDSSDEKINKIIFVGGYCSNKILISEIKKILLNKIKYFLVPSKPCLSIMEGAVLFGLNPEKISQRKARYTIGINIRYEWDESIHSKGGKKVYDEINKVWRCEGCFDIFFKINQDLTLGQEITKNYMMSGPRYFDLRIYKTVRKDVPIFVNEEGIEKMGKWKLDAKRDYPPKQRDFTVTMRVGGTFIDVKAKHILSGNKINVKLEFN